MINFLLVVIARLLLMLLAPFNFIYVNFCKKKFNRKRLSGYFRDEAVAIDRFGNFQYRGLLNKLLVKKDGYEHGKFAETISSVLGKNQRDNTLTKFGNLIASILDKIDKDHCKNSINLDV